MTRFSRAGAWLLALALLFSASPARARGLTRDELRALALESRLAPPSEPFLEAPSCAAPYAPGTVDPGFIEAAVARLNFLRRLAGLQPVAADAALTGLSQRGAVLMAALTAVSHDPGRPDDMDDGFFAQAALAAANCDLASFNWFSPSLARDCVDWFIRDDTAANLSALAHRRWLLSPNMGRTGLGLALDGEGRSYVALYVTDTSAPADYDLICWPAPGAFPAELMRAETPWSVSPNTAKYDLRLGAPRVLLEETVSGARWRFDEPGDAANGGYYLVDEGRFGDGPALIFRPGLPDEPALEDGYEQNQVWRVTLSGLASADGAPMEPVSYTVEMASLAPIDPASVELSPRSLSLRAGETAEISATVYPRWADDLSYTLSVSDASVAAVDETGLVTALKAGRCLLRAETANGRFDEIEMTVEEGD